MPCRIAIIDLDDTILDTSLLYYDARDTIFARFIQEGLPEDRLLPLFLEKNETARKKGNTDRHAYANVFREMYIELFKGAPNILTYEFIEIFCRQIYTTAPSIIEGSLDLLKGLYRKNYYVVCYTMGDKEIQYDRLYKQSELGSYFDKVSIVKKKDTEELTNLLTSLNTYPEECIYYGDSPKLDAIPATNLGIRTFIRRTEAYTADQFPESVVIINDPREIISYLE